MEIRITHRQDGGHRSENPHFRKQNEMIGFAYSSSQFSNAEIAEKIKQFLDELNLDEHEPRIVEFNIFMDIEDYPKIPIYTESCQYSAPRYATGENLYLDPKGLTTWHLTYPLDGIEIKFESEKIIYWEDVIEISMVHDDPEITYSVDSSRRCCYMCSIVSGFASADLKTNIQSGHGLRLSGFIINPRVQYFCCL